MGERDRSARRFAALVLGAVVLAPVDGLAQPYPARPVRIVVPAPAGGILDIIVRPAAEKVSAALGQPIIIDNRGGGQQWIGTEVVLRAAADGHTLLVHSVTHAVTPSMAGGRWEQATRLVPAGGLGTSHNLFIVPVTQPVTSLREFVALARSKPGVLNYAGVPTGNSQSLAMEMFLSRAGIDIQPVYYVGQPPALLALYQNATHFMVCSEPLTAAGLKLGRIRLLAAASPARTRANPDVPTVAEAGFPDAVSQGWVGLAAPPGTPRAIVERIGAEFARALRLPDIAARFEAMGVVPMPLSPDEYAAHVRAEAAKWGRLVRERGLKAE